MRKAIKRTRTERPEDGREHTQICVRLNSEVVRLLRARGPLAGMVRYALASFVGRPDLARYRQPGQQPLDAPESILSRPGPLVVNGPALEQNASDSESTTLTDSDTPNSHMDTPEPAA